jgi:hypothetical protein
MSHSKSLIRQETLCELDRGWLERVAASGQRPRGKNCGTLAVLPAAAAVVVFVFAGCAVDVGDAARVESSTADVSAISKTPTGDEVPVCDPDDSWDPCNNPGGGNGGGGVFDGGGGGISPPPQCGALCYIANDCRRACGSTISWVCTIDTVSGYSYGHCST